MTTKKLLAALLCITLLSVTYSCKKEKPADPTDPTNTEKPTKPTDPIVDKIKFIDNTLIMDWHDTLDIATLVTLTELSIDNITFAVDDTDIAEIDDEGRLIAKAYGTTTLRATCGTISASVDLSVESDALFYVKAIYTISGRGTVLNGFLIKGKLKYSQPITIINRGDTLPDQNTIITGIAINNSTLVDEISASDAEIGILTRGIEKTDVTAGAAVIAPRTRNNIITRTLTGNAIVETSATAFSTGFTPQLLYLTNVPTIDATVTNLGNATGTTAEPGATYNGLQLSILEGSKIVTYVGQEITARTSGHTLFTFTITAAQ